MTFKTALLITAITTMLALFAAPQFARAEEPAVDASAFNKDDPKYKSEEERRSDPATMDAATLTRATCPTGTCYKDTAPGQGFDTTPTMEPSGEAAKSTGSSTAPVKK